MKNTNRTRILVLAGILATAAATAPAEGPGPWLAVQRVEQSDLVGAFAYDASGRILWIQMVNSSDWYAYREVPADVAEGFAASRSKGGYFGAHVKGRYEFTRFE